MKIFNIDSILIVGFGSIGQRHFQIAKEFCPNAKIAILRKKQTKKKIEDVYCVFNNLKDALKFKPQIAIICSPSSTHTKISMALISQGAHLLIEKPVSNKIKNLDRLTSEAFKNSCLLMVGYNLRFLPSLIKFKSLLNDNFLGKVFSVRCEVGQDLQTWRDRDYRNSVSAKKSLGGGVLLELSHELDYLRWIFGNFEYVQAIVRRQSSLDIDVEDVAHILISFKKNNNNNLIASLSLDFIRKDRIRICHVIGEKGSLKWDGITGKVDFFNSSTKKWNNLYKDKKSQNQSYKNEWAHFLKSINDVSEPSITIQDGIEVLKIIDSIRLSSASGKRVEIN